MMIRMNIYLTETQTTRLDDDKGDMKRSELIRRIIDNYYQLKDERESRNDNN
jgi:metal-responsive CopG/Arc/MetJ family transcriptional regulator